MATVSSHIRKERYMMESGEMIRLTVKGPILTLTAHNMKVNGNRTFSMVLERRVGLTDPSLLGTIVMAKRMASASTNGPMERNTKANGSTMRLLDTDFISGLMAGNTSAIGEATLWTISEYTLGKTGGCMRASIKTIRSTVSESTLGAMPSAMPAGGVSGSSMAWEYSSHGRAGASSESGRMAASLGG